MAWGMFDGVHLGHQHVLRTALTDSATHQAPSVVLTFDPHPLSVVCPDRAPRLLQPLKQRLQLLKSFGFTAALVVPFTSEVACQSGEAFMRQLVSQTGGLRSLSVGEGFQFGQGRSGNISLLQFLGQELHFGIHAVSPIAVGGKVVSSSRIRQNLREGHLEEVADLLGRPYSLLGLVQTGDQLGRKWGVPTANLPVTGLELPPHGVYAARVSLGQEQLWRPAVLNLGIRPTLNMPQGDLRFEVHLLDFQGDLYGQEIEVAFVQFLRAERKFDSVDALREQIGLDQRAARAVLL